MSATTISPVKSRPFSWSYSALTRFENCPRQYFHYNIAKDIKEEESEEQRAGKQLHSAFSARIGGTPLRFPYKHHEAMFLRLDRAKGEKFGEQKLALDAKFNPSSWMANQTWYRGVIDFLLIDPPKAVVVDWKTGKHKVDVTQLQLSAALVFAHNPDIDTVKTSLAFVSSGTWENREFVRQGLHEIWADILPRVEAMGKGVATRSFPPQPGGLCRRYCAVTACEYHGKGTM